MSREENIEREESIERIVRSVLEERFQGVEILEINVQPDYDEDGDSILLVTVVFSATGDYPDAREASSLARRILPEFEAAGAVGFPVFSFVADSELRKIKPDAR